MGLLGTVKMAFLCTAQASSYPGGWPVSPSPEVRSAETWSHQQLLFPTAVHSEFPDSLLQCNNAGCLRMGNETDIPGGERETRKLPLEEPPRMAGERRELQCVAGDREQA